MRNFRDTKLSCELAILSGSVPIIVGERGIGKSSLLNQLAKEMDAKLFQIDGNLLKEGEIGGMPIPSGTDSSFLKQFKRKVDKHGVEKSKGLIKSFLKDYNNQDTSIVTYSTFWVLDEIRKVYENNPNKVIILFIDELNRCEHAVQQELMNLILNREINGFKLPPSVRIVAAENPSQAFSEFVNTDYQTVEMDEAQKDRLTWLLMQSDSDEWLKWAIENELNEHVIEYVTTTPQVLNDPNSTDDIKPSPRSWERASKTINIALKNRDKFDDVILANVLKGDIGKNLATSIVMFIKHNENPILKPDEIFNTKGDNIDPTIIEKIKVEKQVRQSIIIKSMINHLEKKVVNALRPQLLEVMKLLPKDLRVANMKYILSDKLKLHKKMVDLEDYIKLFEEIDQAI